MSSRVLSRGFVHDTFNSLLALCLFLPEALLGSTRYFSFLPRPVDASLSPCLGETLFLRLPWFLLFPIPPSSSPSSSVHRIYTVFSPFSRSFVTFCSVSFILLSSSLSLEPRFLNPLVQGNWSIEVITLVSSKSKEFACSSKDF